MRKRLVSVVVFSLFFIGSRLVVYLPERTEMGLITASDQTVRAMHSCNTCFYKYMYICTSFKNDASSYTVNFKVLAQVGLRKQSRSRLFTIPAATVGRSSI